MRRASILAVCLLIMSSALCAAAYTVREAVGLQDSASLCDINNSGHGVGAATGADGRSHAVRWSTDGIVVDLGQGYSLDINNAGQVLGHGAYAAFVSNPDGTVLDLSRVMSGSFFPQRMNDSGSIVGYTLAPGMLYRGFVWSSRTGAVVLDVPSGDAFGYATDINNLGQVVGYTQNAAQTCARPFLWSSETGMVMLAQMPGAAYCMPSRINDAGRIVGNAWGDLGDRVVLWEPDGSVIDLGSGQAAGLNSRGQVLVSAYGGSHVLNPDGSTIDLLPLPGATGVEVYGINDQGVVVGKSIWGNGVLEKAAVWEPEPEPTGITVAVDVRPDTLNLKSKGSYITCYVETSSAQDIDVSSLRLQGDIAPARDGCSIGDYDGDGVPDLMVKFNREALCSLLQPGSNMISLTGSLADGTQFSGEDVIEVITGGR